MSEDVLGGSSIWRPLLRERRQECVRAEHAVEAWQSARGRRSTERKSGARSNQALEGSRDPSIS